MKDFAKALEAAMAARGVVQRQLAEPLGVKQNTVSRWVSGDTEPEPETVFAIEQVLELEPGTLSQHLGYLPLGTAEAPCTIEAAIARSSLPDYQRAALLSVYRSFLGSAET